MPSTRLWLLRSKRPATPRPGPGGHVAEAAACGIAADPEVGHYERRLRNHGSSSRDLDRGVRTISITDWTEGAGMARQGRHHHEHRRVAERYCVWKRHGRRNGGCATSSTSRSRAVPPLGAVTIAMDTCLRGHIRLGRIVCAAHTSWRHLGPHVGHPAVRASTARGPASRRGGPGGRDRSDWRTVPDR